MKMVLSMLCLFYAVEAYTFANITKLYKDLFTNYEKEFRPGENQSIQTELKISFYFKSIDEFQDINRKMGLLGSLGVEWSDVRLVWKPSDYGVGLNQTFVPVNKIWTPYLFLTNSHEDNQPILSGGFSCRVWYDGNVSCLAPPITFEALCSANTTYYPFDTRRCILQLYVSGYFHSDLKLMPKSSTLNTDMYIYDGPWSITSTSIYPFTHHVDNISFELLYLTIDLKRTPETYLWHISPMFVLSVMQLLVFRLPYESGERISFSLTILLAEVIFLTVTEEKLPKTSDVPVLVFKQFGDITISFVLLIGVIYASRCYDKAKTKEHEKTEDTPGIVQTKVKYPSGEVIDRLFLISGLILTVLINGICYVIVSY